MEMILNKCMKYTFNITNEFTKPSYGLTKFYFVN